MRLEAIHQKNAKLFRALGDPNRLAILALLRSGEKCACVLMERLDMGQSAVSYHMKILCASGVVTSRQEGKWTHYRLSETGGPGCCGAAAAADDAICHARALLRGGRAVRSCAPAVERRLMTRGVIALLDGAGSFDGNTSKKFDLMDIKRRNP